VACVAVAWALREPSRRIWLPNRSSLTILHILWLPRRRLLAEATVASQGRAERARRAVVAALAWCRVPPRFHREDGRTGGLREARTHFLIRRTESKNISFEGSRGKRVFGSRAAARAPILASARPPVLPVLGR